MMLCLVIMPVKQQIHVGNVGAFGIRYVCISYGGFFLNSCFNLIGSGSAG